MPRGASLTLRDRTLTTYSTRIVTGGTRESKPRRLKVDDLEFATFKTLWGRNQLRLLLAGESSKDRALIMAVTGEPSVRIGVLALQGSFREHVASLNQLPGVQAVEVRTADELREVDGLIIPGGVLLDRSGESSLVNQQYPNYSSCTTARLSAARSLTRVMSRACQHALSLGCWSLAVNQCVKGSLGEGCNSPWAVIVNRT